MDVLGIVGFALAAVGYLIFSLLLIAARNDSAFARLFLFSALLSVFSFGAAALQINLGFSLLVVLMIDSLKSACWSLVILSCNVDTKSLKDVFNDDRVKQYFYLWLGINALVWTLTLVADLSYQYVFLLFLIINLGSLVLLEQLFRAANQVSRWALWPLVISIASMALFDFVLFAQASMVGEIDFDFWYSRGYIAVFIIPLLLISTRRLKGGQVRVFVSRHVVFYSSMLMIAGSYLLIMAFAGYIINYVGGEWGSMFSIGFLMLAGVVLVALLLTETLRRRVKVFIAKNFFANKYEYRDEWLDLIEKIETTTAENYYQMATEIMMSKLDVKQGALLKRQLGLNFTFKYTNGLELSNADMSDIVAISQFCQQKSWIFDAQEYLDSPSSYGDLTIDGDAVEKQLRFAVPVFIGRAFYGMFVFNHAKGDKSLNWEDRDLLFAISKQLGNFISLHEANDKLAESKQFDAFNRMSAFLVHDLKNVLGQLALINANAKKHRDNPAFIDDVFETVDSAANRLDKMLSQLRNKQSGQSFEQETDVDLLLTKMMLQVNIRQPKVTYEGKPDTVISIDHDSLSSVLHHLVQNAQEATEDDGWVKVTLMELDHNIEIVIQDNGKGMSKEFIKNRLFKPFDTTKGNAGMGIGVYEAKQFVENNAGSISVKSRPGEGTEFILNLPKVRQLMMN